MRRGNWRSWEQDDDDDFGEQLELAVEEFARHAVDPLDIDEVDYGRSTIWDGHAEDALGREGRQRPSEDRFARGD